MREADDQDGFIGWKAAAFVDFSRFHLSADAPHGRFYVELDYRIEVYGSVHVDLGKLGKIRDTDFSAEQSGPDANRIKIGCYFVIGTKGIYLKPVLEDLSIEKFEVFLRLGTLAGTPFGKWGAVIGYIFDVILGKLIALQIPIHLDLELRKYMAKMMFTIFDAYYAAEIEGLIRQRGRNLHLAALYEMGPEGVLLSTDEQG
jgi:hypothetical protein